MKYDKTKDRAGTDEQFPYPMRLEYDKENDQFVVTVYKLPNTKTEAGIRDLYPTTTWLSDSLNYDYQGSHWRLVLVLEGESPLSKLYESITTKKMDYRPFRKIRRGGKYEGSSRLAHTPDEGQYYTWDGINLTCTQSKLSNLIRSIQNYDPDVILTPFITRFRASLRLVCFPQHMTPDEDENYYVWSRYCNYRTIWNSNPIEVSLDFE